ncbi:MAG: polysaccharide lyase beta-sandwich domain-containing protein [Bacteroidales bacterium]|nr:polysaccharide lyase beta-sandwich domain-containing protein [Bacteroidales bacterium]
MPGADAEQTADFASHNDIQVLSNTRSLQAVMDAGAGIAYAVMYAGGELRLGDSLSIASETPVMLLVRFDASTGAVTELVASDPSRSCSSLHLTVRSAGSSRSFDVVLPKGELGGSSVQL